MKRFLILLVFPLLLASCNKKELEEIELAPPVTWEAHQQFMYNQRFITNLHGTDEDLFVLGRKHLSRISHATDEEKMENLALLHYESLANYKFPFNEKVFVVAENGILYFKLNTDPLQDFFNLVVHMTEVDPDFRRFELIPVNRYEAIALSDNNMALVPYTTIDHQMKLLLVKFEVEERPDSYPGEKISLKESKIIDLPNNGFKFGHIKSLNNFFYVSTQNGLVRISEEGVLENVWSNHLIYSIFKHKGNLYSTAWNIDRLTLYTSTDGRSWIPVADYLRDLVRNLSFYPVSDDLLLGVYNSQLFELDLTTMQIRELDNTGLEGHYITSVAKVKEKVYVGTQSGLFSKDAAHLLTYKNEEGK